MYIQSELLAEEIDEAYESKIQEVKVIDDTEEETVTDEPIIRGGDVEQINEPLAEETKELPEQDDEVFVSPVYRQYLEAQKANPQGVFNAEQVGKHQTKRPYRNTVDARIRAP